MGWVNGEPSLEEPTEQTAEGADSSDESVDEEEMEVSRTTWAT